MTGYKPVSFSCVYYSVSSQNNEPLNVSNHVAKKPWSAELKISIPHTVSIGNCILVKININLSLAAAYALIQQAYPECCFMPVNLPARP